MNISVLMILSSLFFPSLLSVLPSLSPFLPFSFFLFQLCSVSRTLVREQNSQPLLFVYFPDSLVAGFLAGVFFLVSLHSLCKWSLNNHQIFHKQCLFLLPLAPKCLPFCDDCFPLTFQTCVQTDPWSFLAQISLILVLCFSTKQRVGTVGLHLSTFLFDLDVLAPSSCFFFPLKHC